MKTLLLMICAASATMTACAHANALQAPPIRPIGRILRISEPNRLGSVTAVRALPNGRVIVNDIVRRQLVLFDSTLSDATIVLDSAKLTGGTFGAQVGGMIAYKCDSTIFVDPSTLAMLVVDSRGKVARAMAAPRAEDVAFLAGGPFGTPAFDLAGRLVYRGMARPIQAKADASSNPLPFQLPEQPDSAPIVRFDFATRKTDTLGLFKTTKSVTKISRTEDGAMSITLTINPMQTLDDWALLSDGSLAIVRGRDYHIDWVSPDGVVTTTPKMPFAWRRMSDADKRAVLDSARIAVDRDLAATKTRLASGSGDSDRPGGGTSARPGSPAVPVINLVSEEELPEYRPAFLAGAARADLDGRLWIRTTDAADGPVYDVINRQGEIVDRVRLPRGRVISGFGAHATVFMGVLDAAGGARIEEASLR